MKAHAVITRTRSTFSQIGTPEAILLVLWLLLNTFFLIHRGIFLQKESAKYIYEAQVFLATGRPGSSNFYLYFIQIILLAFCIKFHLGFFTAVLIQLFFNLIATAFFFKTIQYIFGNVRIAFVATLLLLSNYYYQEFNTFLYTESLFYSFTLILSCYIIHIQTLTAKKLLAVAGMLMVICITRPTGLLFLPPTFLYLFLVFFKNMPTWKKLTLLTGISILFLFLLNLALGSGGGLDFMLPFRDERIICGLPTLPAFLPIKTTDNGNSLYGLLYYLTHNTAQFLRVAGLKSVAFWGVYREWYSIRHNIYLIAFFGTLYLMTLISLGYWFRRNSNILCYLLSAMALNWVTVMLTCDDWHNRFFLSISPFLIILAMPSLQRLVRSPTKKPLNES
jgi:hypothetical protein